MSDDITINIDGIDTSVPRGTLVIRAAEKLGIDIPRFCDHPLLEPAGACRQCLVDVEMPDREGNLRPMPKPQASCTLAASDGMVIRTQLTSPTADKAQKGVLELLLINHPLDCPICDKGGECPLQNQALSHGHPDSRFTDVKRTFPKPINVSTQILLDRERCVLCQRCTRFSKQIAGDAFIDLQKRGAMQQIGRFDATVLGFDDDYQLDGLSDDATALAGPDLPVGPAELDEAGDTFSSYFSGNTIQICPVGALTSAAYRFRARPFDLVSTPAIAEHDSSGSAIRVDHRRGSVLRRLAGNDPAVNEEWITDKDRFAFTWHTAPGRITTPMVRERGTDGFRGELREASWNEALQLAARGLTQAANPDTTTHAGVLTGGRLTIEDSYAYATFARVALGTNDIDARARVASTEEEHFLGAHIAGRGVTVTFADLEQAAHVVLVGYEPEEEGGVVFLRLRKAARTGTLRTWAIAPFASRGLQRIDNSTLLATRPGDEATVLHQLAHTDEAPAEIADLRTALHDAGNDAIIVVGERLAGVPGAYSALTTLTQATGARVAWIPRRIGERAALEMGALPTLLPGGRPVTDPSARVDLAAHWGVDTLPSQPGRSTSEILAALSSGELNSVLVGGLELADLPDPDAARNALDVADFVVSLEVRHSDVTPYADVILPVAPPSEKAGAYWNWEGRVRTFGQALTTNALPDHRVLAMLADTIGRPTGTHTLTEVRAHIDALGPWDGTRLETPHTPAPSHIALHQGEAILATWHLLLDDGALQVGERFLAGTAKTPVARISADTAAAIGVTDGHPVTVSTPRGSITLPAAITTMPRDVVWLPQRSPGSHVYTTLGATAGDRVTLTPGTPETEGKDQ